MRFYVHPDMQSELIPEWMMTYDLPDDELAVPVENWNSSRVETGPRAADLLARIERKLVK